jgi:ADP-heptose:LPS heptosyltransferase
MVISFPVFDGLKERFPHITIAILGSPTNYQIIRNDPRFDKIYIYRKSPLHDIKELIAMRREKYDCVVDMIGNDSVTALFMSQLCAPGKPRIGVGKVKYREYYDFNYDHRMDNTGHIIENTLRLLEAFAIDSTRISGYAEPHLEPKEIEQANRFIESLDGAGEQTLKVGFNMSAGSPTRMWAEEKAVDLLKRITNKYENCRIILSTVPSERRRAEKLRQMLNGNVVLVPDGLSLSGVAAIIKYLDVLISPDTSLVHIARSFRVPVVGLYSRYMKNFLLWRPYDQKTGAVVSGSDDNIFDITVDQVFDTLSAVLDHALEAKQ